MMISRIAEDMLTSKQRSLLNQYVNYGTLPEAETTYASAWQDDLTSLGVKSMSNWHFCNNPFDDEGFSGRHNLNTYNVSSVLNDLNNTLMDPTTTDPWTLGFVFRSIIHFVGDIHTPHHNTARYAKDFPNGDRGGTLYYISCPYGSRCNTMHFLWDAAGGDYAITNPLLDINIKAFKSNVSLLKSTMSLKEVESKNFELESFNPSLWSQESFKVGCEHGYSIPIFSFPDESYLETVQSYSHLRIATAGYRLGHYLNLALTRENLPTFPSNIAREIIVWILDGILLIGSILLLIYEIFHSNFIKFVRLS